MARALGVDKPLVARFSPPLQKGEQLLGRTSPFVESLAAWVLDSALDPDAAEDAKPLGRRITLFRTPEVRERTHLIVARFRYHVRTGRRQTPVLAEEIVPVACTGPADQPVWLDEAQAERLLEVEATENLTLSALEQQLGRLLQALPALQQSLQQVAETRALRLREAHDGVRSTLGQAGTTEVRPIPPADILSVTLLLPKLS